MNRREGEQGYRGRKRNRTENGTPEDKNTISSRLVILRCSPARAWYYTDRVGSIGRNQLNDFSVALPSITNTSTLKIKN